MKRSHRQPLAIALATAFLLAACAAGPSEAASRKKPSKQRVAQRVLINDAPDVVTYGRRDDVMRFAAEAAQHQGLDREWVEAQLARARYQPTVARLIMPAPAGAAKDWAAYRARFVEPQRISAGLAFWHQNAEWLTRAEDRYGVPAELIVGIVGVETYYGRITGNFSVLDALATLSFDFPAGRSDRSTFFRQELEQFLVMCRREGLDPTSVKGSYAGAMGLPQFMPSSVNRVAVDFDGDGHIDLLNSPADVIGSVAHFLAEAGWQRGMPTHYEVQAPVETRDRALLLAADIVPSFTSEQMAERGAVLSDAGRAHDGLLAMVELQNGDAAPSYVAGTKNFYAVTRYNWSSYYAMAVIELGATVRKERGGPPPGSFQEAAGERASDSSASQRIPLPPAGGESSREGAPQEPIAEERR
ncbi:MAG TPA: lytic murein transglycosylase B [Burkholderiaceae bacterium]|nr:lytic murein transglycosylase B [Burkholderiaceae bacterium]